MRGLSIRSKIQIIFSLILAGVLLLIGVHSFGDFLRRLYPFLVFVGVGFSWTRSMQAGLYASTSLYAVVSLASAVKAKNLGVPVVAQDIYAFVNLVGNQEILYQYGLYGLLSLLIILGVIGFVVYLVLKTPIDISKSSLWKGRFLGIAIMCAFVLSVRPIYSEVLINKVVNIDARIHLKKYGAFPLFLGSFSFFDVKIPDQKNSELFLSKRAELNSEIKSYTKNRKPDVLVWLNESTIDLALLNLAKDYSKDYSFMNSHFSDVARGLLKVNTFGGGTWLSEFSFFAGLSHNDFGPAGMYAPYTINHKLKNNIFKEFKHNNYKVVVVYPVEGTFFGAEKSYRSLGIDEFISPMNYQEYLSQGEYPPSDSTLANVTESLFKKHYSENSQQPLFVFVLTMANHGPYGKIHKLEQFPELGQVQISSSAKQKLADYLERLKDTDLAHKKIHEFMTKNKKHKDILFMSFGDHHPNFEGLWDELPWRGDLEKTRYLTYYFLQSNFMTPKQSSQKSQILNSPALDVSMLGSLLVDVAQLEKSEFYKSLSAMRQLCEGKVADCADQSLVESFKTVLFYDLGVLVLDQADKLF